MKNLVNIKPKDNITFGILFLIFFLIIGLYPLKSGGVIRIWSLILSLIFLIITIIRPNLFTFLNRLWIKFGMLLGKIISPIVMSLVFFFVVTLIGILVRILKKDVMGLKRGAPSYWINREDKIQSMKKQF
ncbi:SxtJ family membrane protein [Candidatus Fonsibacter ubiquis]|uniref:SxtJ family membrane protein n=1 Tax=Candidatus Fonsibacter ubiquis TaxID=1925548 RepID=UPI000C07A5F3|nr:SxtJ family membrane protein [Candidatus Fonsibacter ubiquis]